MSTAVVAQRRSYGVLPELRVRAQQLDLLIRKPLPREKAGGRLRPAIQAEGGAPRRCARGEQHAPPRSSVIE